MTVKELAEYFGKGQATIRRVCNKAGITSENGIEKIFTKEEVEKISRIIYKKVPLAVKQSINDTFSNDQGLPLSNEKVNNNDQMINIIMLEVLTKIVDRLDRLELKSELKDQKQLPSVTISPRDKIREVLSKFANKTNVPYKEVWNEFYSKCYYALHINAPLRAKGTELKGIDILEREGLIDKALSIAYEYFK